MSGDQVAGAIQRRVVCAAIRGPYGLLICGARHHDAIMRNQLDIVAQVRGKVPRSSLEQGFIDQWGKFMDRKEALGVALAAGQRIRRCGGDEHQLYSENLY